MSIPLSQLSDHDIEFAYYTQQQQLERCGVVRTPLIDGMSKREALNTWFFDLAVNEQSPAVRRILFETRQIDDLAIVMAYGPRVYRETLDTLFSHHDGRELKAAIIAMDEWLEAQEHQRTQRTMDEKTARAAFAGEGIIPAHPARGDEDDWQDIEENVEVDFFVVTGENHSLGIYDNNTETFFAPSLSERVNARRGANDNDPAVPSGPSLG